MQYELIRSKRRTLALEIRGDRVIVRSPIRLPQNQIDSFVSQHKDWIEKKIAKAASAAGGSIVPLSDEEIESLARKAKEDIPPRVEKYAALIGVSYGRIAIRAQKTKWGSCSSKGNLNFNCLLMLCPEEVIDCIVVHELCHRKEMNHSDRFYAEVRRVYPEYDRWSRWLKDNGGAIIGRLVQE